MDRLRPLNPRPGRAARVGPGAGKVPAVIGMEAESHCFTWTV
ncbi:hypothetical protein UO65_4362 [Actinokineospora spheciospongiae]|uniref:Uncharacterized protein n=1 Tax=Actinokineospora spheciospongiae TaxID=909613 RepID=W7J294_9PSEU|nr:hypothetical protein UO65_4362 [Actinokineospora spheciospongiae]